MAKARDCKTTEPVRHSRLGDYLWLAAYFAMIGALALFDGMHSPFVTRHFWLLAGVLHLLTLMFLRLRGRLTACRQARGG